MPDILNRLTDRAALEAALAARRRTDLIDAEALARTIKAKVIGQDRAIDEMAKTLRRRSAMDNRGKPLGVFCLAGPPGVGKTYCAKVMAEALDRPFKQFDMSSAGTAEGASTLFGAPEMYQGSKGQLTSFLRDFPTGIVLLDEFEKSIPEVMRRFLTAWNDGFVTEARGGGAIDCTKAVFILTTNAAFEAVAKAAIEYAEDRDQLQRTAKTLLGDVGFPPEVLSRIDRVFAFAPLGGIENAAMIALEINALVKNYRLLLADKEVHGVAGIATEVFLRIDERANATEGGVREVVRLIEDEIADHLIEAQEHGYQVVALGTDALGRVTVQGVLTP